MKARRLLATCVALCFVLVAGEAMAQGRQRPGRAPRRTARTSGSTYGAALSRPPVSPYLNLLRPELDPATNYYTLVRPPIQQRAATFRNEVALENLRQRVDEAERSPFGATNEGLAPTGSNAMFMNLSHYYPGSRGGAGRSRR